jgi:hypothetical protein
MATTSVSHVHDWARKVYVDYCHYTLIVKRCKECGTVHEDHAERDFHLNGLQICFAREDCRRCRELCAQANVWPESWVGV